MTPAQMVSEAQLLLPKPRRNRDRFLVPIALYGECAQLLIPEDMTEAEARKIANVVLAYAKVTPFNGKRS